ncbi:murein biosynthesis integral membrane protein MurJ [Candidatus Saccharibacteria bacterium HGW-Saccharibacteria-1]|nr:MAG: murein biosynthesis integral membrane protein MurJ [Candidatus Saccharibacteria bacterium HGW-Saccharibacteria-1]
MLMGRFKNTVAKANLKLPLKLAATLLAGSTFLSSILGLIRDRQLNGLYYSTYPQGIDAYTVAFTIPDFMFFILVSGALSVTFIPVFNQRLADGNKKSAWELSASMLNFMAILTLITSVLIIIFAEPLVHYVVGPGLDESSRALAVSMMRVIAINPFLFAIASVVSSMQQAVGRFTFFALAPAVYNIGIIIGTVFFTDGITIFGYQIFAGGIMGVALGVVLGSVMQLMISCIGLFGMGFDYDFKIYWKNHGFRKVLSLLPARSLDQGIDYVNSIVETNLASRMAAGTIRAYQQASALSYMPINLIGVAISTAAFPKMAERLGQGRPDLFKKELQSVLRVIIWLALPVMVITYFGRGYIVSFIKNGGDSLMAGILGILSIAILFRSIYHISARSFYAQQNTKTPLYISFFAIGLNIVLAICFTMVLDLGVYGLAWATSIVSFVEVCILFIMMSRTIKGLFDVTFVHAIARMASATGFMTIVTYIMVALLPLSANDQSIMASLPKFILITFVSGLAYVLLSWILKLEEANHVIARIKKILFGRVKGL